MQRKIHRTGADEIGPDMAITPEIRRWLQITKVADHRLIGIPSDPNNPGHRVSAAIVAHCSAIWLVYDGRVYLRVSDVEAVPSPLPISIRIDDMWTSWWEYPQGCCDFVDRLVREIHEYMGTLAD